VNQNVLQILTCPACCADHLAYSTFREGAEGEICDGVVWCRQCGNWYPVEDTLLELLAGDLAYKEDRQRFWAHYSDQLTAIGLKQENATKTSGQEVLQAKQQAHFDWYADNVRGQTYLQYEQMPFWRAFDTKTYTGWRQQIKPDSWLLDVGCAQGRSTLKLADMPINIVAFDISKRLVRQAIERYRRGHYRARINFFVADAIRFPMVDESFDYILVYGVLHHLPDPGFACQEIRRLLKEDGVYFGVENNPSRFRSLFDLLQKLIPIWHEEAGPEALMSDKDFERWFNASGIQLDMQTAVFVPPHVINLVGYNLGRWMLEASDQLGQSIGFLRANGGIIIVRGTKLS
jgi:ubiquinone/menaquinone biosynthesis C-methylase UbiE/uncharacterized protein YbaR (Trm112 family)